MICFHSLPKLALAPLVILVFGIGLASKIAIATALTIIVSALTTYAGVKALDPDQERLFYSLGASRMQVFRKLVVPFCLPWVISVLRVNIGLALTGAIVGEFIAAQHGLGRAILYAGSTYDIALVWVVALVLSTLAVVMYGAVSWLERILRKRHKAVGAMKQRIAIARHARSKCGVVMSTTDIEQTKIAGINRGGRSRAACAAPTWPTPKPRRC